MFSNVWQHYRVMQDQSKIKKMQFWMIQRARKEVFDHFLEFGLLDRIDIACCDSTKCFPTFGNITGSCRINQKSKKCSFEWSKEPKKSFLTIFWSWVLLHLSWSSSSFDIVETTVRVYPPHLGCTQVSFFWQDMQRKETPLTFFLHTVHLIFYRLLLRVKENCM